MLVLVLAVPILRLRHTVDAATRAINDLNDRSAPLLGNVNTTIENVNTALGQVHTSLDGVNLQLAKIDTITGHAEQVTANVANLATVVTAAASNPLVKVAAFSYGVRKAAAKRRHADEEREVRTALKERRRAAHRAAR
jgi:ABC-type transporter Mla subunit MlaD